MDIVKRRKLAFKTGFFSKLAAEGILPSTFFDHAKKAGLDWLTDTPGFLYNEAKGLAGMIGSQAIPAAKLVGALGTLAPLGIGATTGVLSAKLNAPPEPDIEAMRKEELIKLYRRLTGEIQARRRV